MKKTCRLGAIVLICGIALTPVTTYAGPERPASAKVLTPAELRARVKALEQELADARRDYQLLLTTVSAGPSPSQAVTADNSERAALAAKQQAIYDANDRLYEEQARRIEDANWYVKDPTFGVTEQNKVFFRFGWKVTIHNGTPRRQIYDVEVQFLDDQGLIVDKDRLYGQVIAGQDEQILRGDALISVRAALKVSKIHVAATRHPERR